MGARRGPDSTWDGCGGFTGSTEVSIRFPTSTHVPAGRTSIEGRHPMSGGIYKVRRRRHHVKLMGWTWDGPLRHSLPYQARTRGPRMIRSGGGPSTGMLVRLFFSRSLACFPFSRPRKAGEITPPHILLPRPAFFFFSLLRMFVMGPCLAGHRSSQGGEPRLLLVLGGFLGFGGRGRRKKKPA